MQSLPVFQCSFSYILKNPEVHMKSKKTYNSQIILSKMNKLNGTTLSEFKEHYEAVLTDTTWYWPVSRHIHQWNRKISSEINLLIYCQLIFDNDAMNINSTLYKFYCENNHNQHKTDLKNTKPKTVSILEKKRLKLHNIGLSS